MKIKERAGRLIETEIKDLAYNGKSVGSIGGKIVFLDRGLPGEKVRAEITKSKSRYSVGKVKQILNKSGDRIEAPCRHFDVCGGCAWQDLDYDNQLFYKRRQVVDCLQHIGRLNDIAVDDITGCEEKFFYRNKMEFSFNRSDQGFTLGLHSRGRFDDIFNVEACLLQSELSNQIVKFFRDFVAKAGLAVYDVANHSGFIRFLVIREAKNTNQLMINIVTTDGDIPKVDALLEKIIHEFPSVKTVVHNINNQKSNIARGEKEEILYGRGFIEEKILNKTFRIYANSFFQTNSRQAEVLYRTAFDLLEPNTKDILLDLYCGAGVIGICASDYVDHVIGVELESAAVKAAGENAEINGIRKVTFHTGSVEKILKEKSGIFEGVTCAVVDPPRAGIHAKALKRLIELDLSKVVYISCNPATFARDAVRLVESGYKLNRVVPVDMFPHTMHIELAAGFYK